VFTPCVFWDQIWIRLRIWGRLVKELSKQSKNWRSYIGGKISALWIVTTIPGYCTCVRDEAWEDHPAPRPRPGCIIESQFFGTVAIGQFNFYEKYQSLFWKEILNLSQKFCILGQTLFKIQSGFCRNFLQNAIWILQDAEQIIINLII
jgi:hypothetical protein